MAKLVAQILFCLYCLGCINGCVKPGSVSGGERHYAVATGKMLEREDDVNLYCLRLYYPVTGSLEKSADGQRSLSLANGQRIVYDRGKTTGLDADIKNSMQEPYPLDPERPGLTEGQAPGRKRSYELLRSIYGSARQDVESKLESVNISGIKARLVHKAAKALKGAELDKLASLNPDLRKFLKPDGGFAWRKIAGEAVPSAHSYGIALDLSAGLAPYWRWSRQMPHPMQKTYPKRIVAAMEEAGFIWGGKWREYDLMHFEYRPEIICKARIMRAKRETKSR